jgi:large subunit ribosomal protein L22
MISKASLKYTRGSSKKYKAVIDLIRGKKVEEALDFLMSMNKAPKKDLIKLINSALSNARDKEPDATRLFISKIRANQGPSYKRFRAEAFGRASVIRKRTSHIEIELDRLPTKEKENVAKKASSKKAAKAKKAVKAIKKPRKVKKTAAKKVKKQKEK